MAELIIERNHPLCLGEFKNKPAILAQVASATEDISAGTLLVVNGGKMEAYTAESESFPVAVLLNPVEATLVAAGDVPVEVVYGSRVSSLAIAAANPDVTIDDAFIWNCWLNGLDIYVVQE